MKTVFIIGPFIKDPEGNRLKFEAMALKLWQAGFFAFNPIANCYYMFGKVPEATFVQGNTEMIKKGNFDAAILLEGWRDSQGSKKEIDTCVRAGMNIFESFDDLCRWDKISS
jgi:hypothetical protein